MRRAAVLVFPAVLLAAQDPGLEGARKRTQALYTAHLRGDMAFTAASVQAKAGHLAPDLAKACLAKLAEAATSGSDEAPDLNGDPFTDSQEYPDAFKVGRARAIEGGARVPVTFTWTGGNPPRTLLVVLRNLQSGWRIDDLRYADGRTLRGLLRAAGPSPR